MKEEDIQFNELISKVYARSSISQEDVKKVFLNLRDVIKEELKKGNSVQFTRLFTAIPKIRKGRIGINPRTHEEISIPDTKTVHFKPSEMLKRELRKQNDNT